MLTKTQLFQTLQKVSRQTAPCLYSKEKCEEYMVLINEINKLKREKQAVVLAHSYVAPEIVYGIADFVGDSYKLSVDAKKTKAKIIVFAAVKFMAETAKILNPKKTVLVPSTLNGCSLADSISVKEIRLLKKKYPDYTFICYINTTADIKAHCDITVTSSNVYKIIEKVPSKKIFFLPDYLMGKNIIEEIKKKGIKKEIRLYNGSCYVHEAYDQKEIIALKRKYPRLKVVSHPECNEKIIKNSDFNGSTSQMLNYVKNSNDKQFFILSECGLTSRMQVEMKKKEFIGTCNMCRYMKSNSLQDILRVLKNPNPQDLITLDSKTIKKAKKSLDKMFYYSK